MVFPPTRNKNRPHFGLISSPLAYWIPAELGMLKSSCFYFTEHTAELVRANGAAAITAAALDLVVSEVQERVVQSVFNLAEVLLVFAVSV